MFDATFNYETQLRYYTRQRLSETENSSPTASFLCDSNFGAFFLSISKSSRSNETLARFPFERLNRGNAVIHTSFLPYYIKC